MSATSSARYAASVSYLHWLMFLLVLGAYTMINLHEATPRGTGIHSATVHAHFLFGLGVLVLILPRLWVRTRNATPPIEPPMARWSHLFAKLTHIALYAFLLVQPILGLVTLQIKGGSVTFFGLTLIPSLVEPNRELARAIFQYHELLGTIFYWVIGLHILAALWHHYVRRDDTLKRMLPLPRRDVRPAQPQAAD
ncbi:MAG TPA: cytochrome b [Rhodanobacteraceae bacterium]|nr:cytochrome b [Rhodanobacteraceae bacterium]